MSTNTDTKKIQNQQECQNNSQPLSIRQIAQRERRQRERNNPTAPNRPLPIFSTPNQYSLGQQLFAQRSQRESELMQRRSGIPMDLDTIGPAKSSSTMLTNALLSTTFHQQPQTHQSLSQNSVSVQPSRRTIAQRARRERERERHTLPTVEVNTHLSPSPSTVSEKTSSTSHFQMQTQPHISLLSNSSSLQNQRRVDAQRLRRERERNSTHVSQVQPPSTTTFAAESSSSQLPINNSSNNSNSAIRFVSSSSNGNSIAEHQILCSNVDRNFSSTTQRFMNMAENGMPTHQQSQPHTTLSQNIPTLQPTRRTIAQRERRERERNALPNRHYLGRMNVRCKHCNALHWLDERLKHSSKINPLFGSCCLQGKVKLPPLSPLPPTFQALYEGTDQQSREFQENIRSYNAANAFSSLGVKLDDRVLNGHGPKSFTIHGQLHHSVGSLLPDPERHPTYAQLYIYDAQTALNYRQQRNPHLREDVLHIVQQTLLQSNQLCKVYKHAYEILRENHSDNNEIFARLHHKEGTDQRRYNLPTSNEIAVIMPGDGSIPLSTRDIVLRYRGHRLERISECHPLYLPSHYVLLFPNGDLGWSLDHKLWDIDLNTWSNKRMTQLHYHSYRIFERDGEYSSILRGGPLFEEYIVDAWAAYEQNRLYYLQTHQTDIRAECYIGLTDIVRNGVSLEEIGQRYILPSTHIGSPRHMYEIYQDSMAITRYNKHPDIFLTMTANPNWKEIKDELKPRQKVTDRPDLVARVFELKRQALIDQIVEKKIFGEVAAYVFTIEFQKRGLPHMHALIFLKHPYKINTCTQVDQIVCAEFPDPITQPLLFETIKKCMIHGPCGKDIEPNAVCMENGVCSAKYPRVFVDNTSMDRDGYPLYRRRETGEQYEVRGHMVDNRNVVPYNPHLSTMFDAHINVEVCASVRAVKYIHKYIYKGFDKATMVFVGVADEIQQYIDARYVGSPEAAYRILSNPMHKEWPNVVRLALHLPGMNKIPFNINETPEEVLARAENEKTTLTAFFKYYSDNPETTPYTYQEFPEHFVWDKSEKVWTPRNQGFAIGRMYFASPNCGERFYLRLLLTVVKAPESFDDLKMVETKRFNTFKEACIARGLLEDDEEWTQCLEEASTMKTGHQLRKLFTLILLECSPTQPGLLWEKFAPKICDDCAYLLLKKYYIQNPTTEQAIDYGLYLLQQMCLEAGKELSDIPGMPLPTTKWKDDPPNRYIAEQADFLHEGLEEEANSNINRLNTEQGFAFKEITDSTLHNKGKVFFLNGPAGTGKTFVYNTIASACRLQGKIVVMVASSGIASLLLTGGRTAHSTFKLPLEIMDNSICGFVKNSERANFLKKADLIIWDEVPMQHRYCVEAVNRTLQDIRNDNAPFGGITVVLGGDFRQTLPIITKGVREEFVGASLRRSPLWQHVNVLNLVQNMRLDATDHDNIEFGNYLMEVGSIPADKVQLPTGIKRCGELEDLIAAVYPGIENANRYATSYFTERTILSARNDDVSIINDNTLTKFPGDTTEYLSADKVMEDGIGYESEGYHYTTDFLNSLDPSCLPPFKLKLKIGCPIMLLRNIAPRDGLCNGTRLMVLQCRPRVIEAMILTGNKAGDRVFIPRITLTPSTSELPFKMSRRQFPVRLAFAMTINKSQGQSVKYVGIDLRTPVFSHGQLYVALSRCTSSKRISVILPPDDQITTTNVVYQEVLL